MSRRRRHGLGAAALGLSLLALAGAQAATPPPADARPAALRAGAIRGEAGRSPAFVLPPRDARAAVEIPAAPAAVVPNPRTAWGPTLATMADARAAVEAMPLEQLAGQVIVARYAGADGRNAHRSVTAWHLAGVIVMADNVGTLEQVAGTAAAVHAAVRADGRPWPAIVAVDEEGGRVSRLHGLLADLPPFAAFGASDPAATHARFALLGRDLRALGFTMDFAPVADVTIGAADPTIGDRSASGDPAVAARAVVAAAGGLLDGGTIPVVKHFPGHGSVTSDSHVTLPLQAAGLDALAARDLLPFQAAVDAGVPAVMVGHLNVAALEPGVPSSLSPAAYRLLRGELGFEGVAVTDALDMRAITGGPLGAETVRAVAAGADLALMPPDAGAAHAALVAAVRSGALPLERLQEAATRVVALQMWVAALG